MQLLLQSERNSQPQSGNLGYRVQRLVAIIIIIVIIIIIIIIIIIVIIMIFIHPPRRKTLLCDVRVIYVKKLFFPAMVCGSKKEPSCVRSPDKEKLLNFTFDKFND